MIFFDFILIQKNFTMPKFYKKKAPGTWPGACGYSFPIVVAY